jgi:hypothetical protein
LLEAKTPNRHNEPLDEPLNVGLGCGFYVSKGKRALAAF